MQLDIQRLIQFLKAMSDQTRIEELRSIVSAADHAYHVLDCPAMTDAEYDQLYRELAALEAANPKFDDPNSPTKRVGGLGVSRFVKTRHVHPMLSLSNVFTAEELFRVVPKGSEVHVEPKIDGLSLKLVYEDGQLVRAITRGDGFYGDDVTINARTIRNIPLRLDSAVDLIVVGEVYMSTEAFHALNTRMESLGDDLFANPRNAASGSMKLKEPKEVALRRLSFVAYGIKGPLAGPIATQHDMTALLEYYGFQSVYLLPTTGSCETVARTVVLGSVEDAARVVEECDRARDMLKLETDGLVFKVNSLRQQEELGEAIKSPKWAWAYKFPPERKATTLQGITLQVGRTGKITPVAELMPVVLGGTTVKRASLCNADEIQRLGVNIGDTVFVEKSAEIIPKVMGVAVKNSESTYTFDGKCPSCASDLVRLEGLVDHFCRNRDCTEQVAARLIHATGKSALDIDGCGEMTVRTFVDKGIRTLSDLMLVTDLRFMKPAARTKFLAGREEAKTKPLWRQLHALGIEGLGQTLCREIGARWASLIEAIDHKDDLMAVVGPSVFSNIEQFLLESAEELDRLQDAGMTFESPLVKGALSGTSIVLTGEMTTGKREVIEARIVEAGGLAQSNVTKSTTYLVVGEAPGRVKQDKAAKFGTKVIDEATLYELMGVPMPSPASTASPE